MEEINLYIESKLGKDKDLFSIKKEELNSMIEDFAKKYHESKLNTLGVDSSVQVRLEAFKNGFSAATESLIAANKDIQSTEI